MQSLTQSQLIKSVLQAPLNISALLHYLQGGAMILGLLKLCKMLDYCKHPQNVSVLLHYLQGGAMILGLLKLCKMLEFH